MHYVGVPLTARFTEFGDPGGPNETVARVYAWLAEHEVVPLGGPLYIYRHVGDPDEPVDLTVAVPIANPVVPTDGLSLGALPAGPYVVGRYTGHPDKIAHVHQEVRAWAQQHGHRLDALRDDAGQLWTGHAEHFLTDPEAEPDRSKWVTDLLFKTV